MEHVVLLPLSEVAAHGRWGGKVEGLRWLDEHGFAVPPTWVIPDPQAPAASMRLALAGVLQANRPYAVRSSANVEDGGAISYAGQFLSVLDVVGGDDVVAAVARVASSSDGVGIRSYRQHVGDERTIAMSVVIQEMVNPVYSGVGFSKNPITGLNETVVEAVVGSGEALMAGGATPERWVHRWGDYVDAPEVPSVDPGVVSSVVAELGDIAKLYGRPIDVEWVYDGRKVWWVQIRPITGIDGVHIYSRRISKEVMPGIIKPLVWSVNVPMVNEAWVDLFKEALGELDLDPEDLAKSFGYRSYFNMSAIGEVFAAMGMPRESLELLLGLPAGSEQPRFKPTPATLRKMPRMLAMALRKMRYSNEITEHVPALEAEYRRFADNELSAASDEELLADVDALRRIGVRAASVNIVTPLLANVYTTLLRKRLGKSGVDLESVDLMEGVGELAAFDPSPHLDRLAVRIQQLDRSTREAVLRDGYDAVPEDLRREIDQFLGQFGHFSDSGNDFSIAPWREQPDTVVKMAAGRTVRDRPTSLTPWASAKQAVPLWQRPLANGLRKRARTFVQHREAVSSTYTYGYGLFRSYFLEIGRRLVERDLIGAPEDVMFLSYEEVRSALAGTDPLDYAILVAGRKEEIAAVAEIDLPEVIYGDDFIPRPADDAAATSWHGTPTARGHHRGVVRVVKGMGDFDRVNDGDVLAIPHSDVGWTPLFAKAGAVVAESGGMLSHSSIVAREYGIPCVVSVVGAMRIPDGATVTVDGYRGVIVLEEPA